MKESVNLFFKNLNRVQDEIEEIRDAAKGFFDTKGYEACECVLRAILSEPKELKKLRKNCVIVTTKPFATYKGKNYCLQFRFSDSSGDFNAVSLVERCAE